MVDDEGEAWKAMIRKENGGADSSPLARGMSTGGVVRWWWWCI